MRYLSSNPSQQQGAVLLLFALLLIIGSTYSLVKKLNSDTNFFTRQSKQTQESLRLAKQALIGYALTYPEEVNPDDGPGYLPCPDRNNDGDAETSCSTNTLIGRFPFTRVEVQELRDASGARLWYALSDNYKNNQKLEPLNSETDGQLSVDGLSDVVAVIIAPGAPINTQNRDPSETDISTEITNYLEGDNNDLDLSFTSLDPDPVNFTDFNDQLITITRQELMEVVEKRVLGEVRSALANYKATHGAYPWLSPFVDPKAVARQLRDTAGSGSNSLTLQDGGVNFTAWAVVAGDTVYNLTDGSIGTVTGAVTANSLSVSSLLFGTTNVFAEDDEYVVTSQATGTLLSGTATMGGDADTLNDSSRTLSNFGIAIGQVVDNITDNSSSVITSISTNSIEVDGLTGGTDNLFQTGDTYQIRNNHGVATGGSATQLDDSSKDPAHVDFTTIGVSVGDTLNNLTDGSIGTITTINSNSLVVDQFDFGTNNQFNAGDRYSFSKFNRTAGTREGHLSLHEVGEVFNTGFNLDWNMNTLNAGDIVFDTATFANVETTYQMSRVYLQNYALSGSVSIADDDGFCIWSVAGIADCFTNFTDFVNISGNLTSGSNTDVITDSTATFNTNAVKRGDIAQNYDDEILVISGTVDAGNSGAVTGAPTTLTLQDTNNDFLNVNISIGDTLLNTTDSSSGIIASVTATQITVTSLTGGTDNIIEVGDDYQIGTSPVMYDASADFSAYERYSYLVQNQTLETELGVGKIQAIIADKEGVDTIIAESYVGESATPMEFRPGDSYRIYQPRQFVVDSVASETQLTADNYTSGTDPDFDNGEYYRIMPAANSHTARVEAKFEALGVAYLDDLDETFIDDGIELGDIVENDVGAFGEITFLTNTRIGATLYGPAQLDFWVGAAYTVYHDYVFSRKHEVHARFNGTQATNTDSNERVRDVCMGYNADCSAVSTPVSFSGNGGVTLFTIRDYEEDETTEVGSATFVPSSSSSGSLKVSNMDYYLHDVFGDLPFWFVKNDWHKLIYIVYSVGDTPDAAAACIAGTNCLTINGVDNVGAAVVNSNNNNAIVIAAGMEINTTQDSNCNAIAATAQNRSNGRLNEYYESNNCSAGDDSFQEQFETNTYNDQLRVVEP